MYWIVLRSSCVNIMCEINNLIAFSAVVMVGSILLGFFASLGSDIYTHLVNKHEIKY